MEKIMNQLVCPFQSVFVAPLKDTNQLLFRYWETYVKLNRGAQGRSGVYKTGNVS